MRQLNLYICGKQTKVDVEDDVYRDYYRFKEREAYLQKKAREHESSIEYFQVNGISFETNFSVRLPSTEEIYFKNLERMALNRAIEMLPPDEQYIIIASFYLGKQGKEIAKELSISPGTVTKRKQRILNKLCNILREV